MCPIARDTPLVARDTPLVVCVLLLRGNGARVPREAARGEHEGEEVAKKGWVELSCPPGVEAKVLQTFFGSLCKRRESVGVQQAET